MIGVISHVADLAERLPSRINVVKNVSGSVVVRESGNMRERAGVFI
jgi:DNA repair exonuclease SbcCD ATPase subunit